MAKFSVDGEEEGEEDGGASSSTNPNPNPNPNPIAKRKRTQPDEDFPHHNQPRHFQQTESDLNKIKRHPHNQPKILNPNISISMFLIDPEVLDCSICCNPLTVPIFQCENGHIACSSCCNKLKNKCATCSWPIGYNRCRAVEKILESIKLPCKQSKYGCEEIVGYGNESDHEKTCLYAPCKCPLSDCNFMASSKQLSLHFSTEHTNSAYKFQFNSSFTRVFLKTDDEGYHHILQEQDDGSLFLLKNSFENMGNMGNAVKICCLRSPTSKEAFSYTLRVEAQDHSLVLQSSMENIRSSSDFCHSKRFLLVPRDEFGSSSKFVVNICIRKNGLSPVCDR